MKPKHPGGEAANLSSVSTLQKLIKKKKPKQPKELNKDNPAQATRLVYLCASTIMGIALLSLIGWISGVRVLAGQWGNLTPLQKIIHKLELSAAFKQEFYEHA